LSCFSEIVAESGPKLNRLQEVASTVFSVRGDVIGTIDVESERANAFDDAAEEFLEKCAIVLRPLFGAEGAARK
jgi:hypothetical protein